MTDGAINELKTCLDRSLSYLLDLLGISNALDVRISSEIKVDRVGVIYSFLRKLLTDKHREISAYLVGQRELSVRERARTRKSRGYMAIGLAGYAFLGL